MSQFLVNMGQATEHPRTMRTLYHCLGKNIEMRRLSNYGLLEQGSVGSDLPLPDLPKCALFQVKHLTR